ncbi:hypothetical protein G7Y89_g15585 [Cudoniella acicularis]|uniref:Uncharacterized protein n=1 Tax=Cudoniella acicularis TaxID=354080 RepID=A0A8H4QKJ9_9HELO|nr:hypothetical protein G7Y89_g15585 [Cudoniella acicularis]
MANQFTFSGFSNNTFPFAFQHHARLHSQNDTTAIITLFDNGSDGERNFQNSSVGMKIAVDFDKMTCTLLQSYVLPNVLTTSQGSVQVLGNSNVFVGWGANPYISEFSSEGELLMQGQFGAVGVASSYRAFKAEWVGTPDSTPALWSYADSTSSATIFWVSWNGATEVQSWRFFGGPSEGTTSIELGSVQKSGFETNFTASAYVAWGEKDICSEFEYDGAKFTGHTESNNRTHSSQQLKMTRQVPRNVLVIIGAGGIGMAVARRLGSGRNLLLGGRSQAHLDKALAVLRGEGYTVEGCKVDVSDTEAVQKLAKLAEGMGTGQLDGIVHTAGIPPVSATAKQIIDINLLGTAHIIDTFYPLASIGTSLVCISSMAGYFSPLSPELERHLALTPTDQLLQHKDIDTVLQDANEAYFLAKRGNHLRVQAAAQSWGSKGARINTVSPGLILTRMGTAELQGPSGAWIESMVGHSGARRAGTPDEIASVVAFLIGTESSYITGSDILVDGGTIASQRWNVARPDEEKQVYSEKNGTSNGGVKI